MPCPTCEHTMQNLGVEGQRIFWCPRCGTLKMCSLNIEDVTCPMWIGKMVRVQDAIEACTKFIYESDQNTVFGKAVIGTATKIKQILETIEQ